MTAAPTLPATYVRELRLAVKDHAMTPAQFQRMVGLEYVPPAPEATPVTDEEREQVIATLAAWRANHPPARKGEPS
ncbi:MAG: hypothetical protein KKB59_10320 [Spirochaetes bacterium]|nr:hypothetical protein [Spirochaetota bacterium]